LGLFYFELPFRCRARLYFPLGETEFNLCSVL
jgi:hypothetical protein